MNVVQKAKSLLGMGDSAEEAPEPPESASAADEAEDDEA